MPFSRPTLAQIKSSIVIDIQTRLPGTDGLLRRSVVGVLATVLAGAIHGVYGFLAWMFKQLFADTAEADHLERKAAVFGIHRKTAWPASGTVIFTGTNGSVIAIGTRVKRSDDVEYLTTAAGSITDGSVSLAVTAVTAGATGNAVSGVSLSLVNPIAGVVSTATVAAAGLTQGADAEKDATLLSRYLKRVQEPPHGGANHDWRAWTLDRSAHGIDVTAVYPAAQEMGAGSMTIRFMMHDSYANGIPQAADVTTVKDYLETVRPVTVKQLYVVAPIADPTAFEISGLNPVSQAVRDAITAELKDLYRREATPGGTVLISHIREAISIAAGEKDHVLVSPVANVAAATGYIATLGEITWS